jgi:membrane-bound lytic murein transglycosylase F
MVLKKIILYIFFLSTSLAGCRTGSESKEPEAHLAQLPAPVAFDLEQIKDRGYITALVDNSSTGYFIYKGQPMGYEYELLQRLAKHLDVELNIKVTKGMNDAFVQLQEGEGDIIANSLTVTKARKKYFAFTDSHYSTRQVLVQKKPDNWRDMTLDGIEEVLIRNQVDLIGKEVHVRKGSSYIERLENLSQELGGDIIIVEEDKETEIMIRNLLADKYDLMVADETVAMVNAAYYPELDVRTPVSFPQQIAWAVRKNSPDLLKAVNKWMHEMKKRPTFNVIYNRYFKNNRVSAARIQSIFHSKRGKSISPYDSLLKVAADSLQWDWRLLASQMYQESRFNEKGKSWAGALGLMQVKPETGKMYGYENMLDPYQNINAATAHLKYLDDYWRENIFEEEERKKFVLASYNVGLGHILDARALARKYNEDDNDWTVIEKYLELKTKPEYYEDPVVKHGYCRGTEPVNYVKHIFNRYNQYQQMINE